MNKKSLLYVFLLWVAMLCTPSLPALPQARTIKIVGGRAPAGTERRLALVVGNKDYARSDARLKNPVNDATDIASALDALGFDVILANNLTLADFKKKIDEFGSRLTNYDVALFYYSGHALQFNGENYLVPTDASLQTLTDAEDDCVRLGRVMGKMKVAGVKNNIVFLDACRTNPFPKNTGDKAAPRQGLVIPNNPPGTLVVFATEEGSTADDNTSDRNGLFTAELLRHLSTPNLSLSDIVLNTRQGVYRRSGERQLPSDYNKMLGAFYFVRTASLTPANTTPPVPTQEVTPVKPAPKTDLPVGPEMVYVKGGTFQMGSTEGSDNEKPVHSVTVSDFMLGKYEVTVSEYMQFVEETNSHYPEWLEAGNKYHIETGTNGFYKDKGYTSRSSRLPIVGVSWDDAVAYCEWLSRKTGRVYRLPREAEWEYAAGGGSGARSRFGNGTDVLDPSEANFDGSEQYKQSYSIAGAYSVKPVTVGSFKGNGLGLYDMSGNVLEWCSDWNGAYSSASTTNPAGPASGSTRVLRGGSWNFKPQDCRVAFRDIHTPAFRIYNIGFRVLSQLQ